MLVELSVMEQRYHAVMEVISGAPVAEVARRYGGVPPGGAWLAGPV
jgi:hypothetical protein